MKRLLILAVKAYRLLLSPWLGSSCRFEPTCSLYALQALQRERPQAGRIDKAEHAAGLNPGHPARHRFFEFNRRDRKSVV